jgi:hypothetical protein
MSLIDEERRSIAAAVWALDDDSAGAVATARSAR